MKGHPPFESAEGEPPPPSQVNPFNLINFALRAGGVQVVNFGSTVREVRTVQSPPAFTCTSESKLHTPSGHFQRPAEPQPCSCGESHGPFEYCSTCTEPVPYHLFPGRGLRQGLLVVEVPASVGDNLKGPPEDRDFFLLIHIPRQAGDEFDRQMSSLIVAPPMGGL